MQIQVITYRECCQDEDMVRFHHRKETAYCRHCLKKHIEERYTDAAGDSDWRWVPYIEPVEVSK